MLGNKLRLVSVSGYCSFTQSYSDGLMNNHTSLILPSNLLHISLEIFDYLQPKSYSIGDFFIKWLKKVFDNQAELPAESNLSQVSVAQMKLGNLYGSTIVTS